MILVKYFGLAGIFLGTTISTLAIPMWTQPKLVFNKIFNLSIKEYYKRYCLYAGITIVIGGITTVACSMVQVNNLFLSLIIKGIICVIIPNCAYLVLFLKTEEMKYLYSLIKPMISKIKSKVPMSA